MTVFKFNPSEFWIDYPYTQTTDLTVPTKQRNLNLFILLVKFFLCIYYAHSLEEGVYTFHKILKGIKSPNTLKLNT